MKLPKTLTDQILSKTNSKPEDLLAWWLSLDRKWKYPCAEKPYLKKYVFCLMFVEEKHDILISGKPDLWDIWWWACKSKRNFNSLTNQFKSLYNLK